MNEWIHKLSELNEKLLINVTKNLAQNVTSEIVLLGKVIITYLDRIYKTYYEVPSPPPPRGKREEAREVYCQQDYLLVIFLKSALTLQLSVFYVATKISWRHKVPTYLESQQERRLKNLCCQFLKTFWGHTFDVKLCKILYVDRKKRYGYPPNSSVLSAKTLI